MSSASAAPNTFASCVGAGYDISGYVTPSLDCTILEPLGGAQNDPVGGDPSGWIVNQEPGFFGFMDWGYEGRFEIETGGGATDGLSAFTFVGDAQSGTFTYDGSLDGYDVMFVFKDGGSTNLVAYLIDLAALGTGTYQSPYVIPPFDFTGTPPRDISHISVYYRTGFDFDIPEPGTLGLLGLGLLGFALVRRRS